MVAIPPKFVTRVNYKPLITDESLARLNVEKVLKSVRKEILQSLRKRIRLEAFSPRAKKALAQGLRTRLGPRSLTLLATHPAFIPLLKGQKRGQMTWLQKSPTPIPVVTDSGDIIFRTASAKSMKDGKWIHPGRKPTRIIDMAKAEAREIVRKRIKQELLRQIRKGIVK